MKKTVQKSDKGKAKSAGGKGKKSDKSVSKKKSSAAKSVRSTGGSKKSKSSSSLSFPKEFAWGCATAAYQIEGAWDADGKGPSIWDRFVHSPGTIVNGDTGDRVCDHYNLYRNDVKLMAGLGFKHYRFSLSWPRLWPDGNARKKPNKAGLDFYNGLVDSLIEHGITPICTLYHWDLPDALQQSYGGMLSPKFVPDFTAYATACFGLFGDRIKSWITFNEPSCICVLGFGLGMHAPGRCSDPGTEVYLSSHHLLLAHAYAVESYRNDFQKKQKGVIGITLNSEWWDPVSPHSEDVAAANRAMDFTLGLYADPIWGPDNDYPKSIRDAAGTRLPNFSAKEKKMLRGSSDFFGLNHYSSRKVGRPNLTTQLQTLPREIGTLWSSMGSVKRFAMAVAPMVNPFATSYFKDMNIGVYPDPPGTEFTTMRWAVAPWGFRKLLTYIQEKWNPAGGIIVTENGLATNEQTADLMEADKNSTRIPFFKEYISEMHKAMTLDGADVRGYYAWSFLDNFEWSFGNDKRFGLVRVDYETLERTPKPVAYWFKKLMEENSIPS